MKAEFSAGERMLDQTRACAEVKCRSMEHSRTAVLGGWGGGQHKQVAEQGGYGTGLVGSG